MLTLGDVPDRYKNLYRRAMSGQSRAAGVKAHCLYCCGWQPREVELCTGRSCPLFKYRPRFKAEPEGAEVAVAGVSGA